MHKESKMKTDDTDDRIGTEQSEAKRVHERYISFYDFGLDEAISGDMEYIIEDVLGKGGVSTIAGRSDSGKSFLALDIVIASLCGQTFMGKKTVPMRFMYLDQEMSASMMKQRYLKLIAGRGLESDAECLKEAFFSRYESWIPMSIVVAVHDTASEDRKRIDEFIAEIKALEIDALILDSWNKFLGGHNESETQVGQVATALLKEIRARTGVSILIVSHINKNEGRVTLDRLRGSSTFVGECDIVIYACKNAEDGTPARDCNGTFNLRHLKHRAISDSEKINMDFDIVDVPGGGIRAEYHDPDKSNTVEVDMPDIPGGDPVDEEEDTLAEMKNDIILFLRKKDGPVATQIIMKKITGKGERIVKALHALCDAGEVSVEKRGKSKYYSVNLF